MATSFIGLAAAPKRDKLYQAQINSNGLLEGAAVVYDSSVAGGMVKAPGGAAAQGFAGLIADVMPSGGTVVGNDVNLQRTGVGMGILLAGQTATVGEAAVIGGTDGSLRPFALGSDDDCDIVGIFEQTLTATAVNHKILVNLDGGKAVHKDAS